MKFKLENRPLAVYMSLVAAMLVGVYLRLRHIDSGGLWLDEAFSVSVSDPDHHFVDVYRATLSDVHPPFYQILLWVYYHCFGFGEFTGRYLSAALGVLLIPSVFFFGRQLFDQQVGVLFAWLVAVNYFLIRYSNETRSYALLVFLTVVSFWLFIRCVRQSGFIDFLGYFVVSAMLINTHYFGYLAVFSQACLALYMLLKKDLALDIFYRFLGAGFFTVLTVLPGLSYTEMAFGRQDFWIRPPGETFFFVVFSEYFGNAFLAFMAAIMFIAGFVSLTVSERKKEAFRLLAFWLVLGVVVPYVCSVYFTPVTTVRNFIVLLPVVLLLIAFAIEGIEDKAVRMLVLVVFLCFSATPVFKGGSKFVQGQNPAFNSMQMREIVESAISKGHGVPVYSSDDIQFGVYFKLLGSPVHVGDFKKLASDLNAMRSPGKFYVLETTYIPSLESDEVFLKQFNAVLISKEELNEVRLLEFRSLKP